MEELEHIFHLYLNGQGLLSDDDMISAFEVYFEYQNPRAMPRLELQGPFSLDGMSDYEILQQFRFTRDQLLLLYTQFEIPDVVNVEGYQVADLTALCVLLRRLSYPNRLVDLERMFGMSKSAISATARWMINFLQVKYGPLTEDLGRLPWLNGEKLAAYSEAIAAKGAPLNNVWAFIDGTARKICRPTEEQRRYYSGHKRYHNVKYQSILTPDGLIVNLKGPYEGRRHDAGIWTGCGVQEQIRRLCVREGRTYVIYGDPAYPVSDILITPYPATNLQPHAAAFNRSMSVVRQAVEWRFGKVVQQFAFVDFSKNQKIQLQNIGGMYRVAVFLTNCHTCLNGSQASQYFGINPPTLEEYLSGH